jgi:hypothetical protein
LIGAILAQNSSVIHSVNNSLTMEVPARCFTKSAVTSKIECSKQNVRLARGIAALKDAELPPKRMSRPTGALMPATGELIRTMNYVDDITATMRRICISIPAMSGEERKRLAEYLRPAAKAVDDALADLEKAGH